MRCLTLATLGLGLTGTAIAGPVDAAVTTTLVAVPSSSQTGSFTNQTALFANETGTFTNQSVAVRQIKPPKVPTPQFPRPECKRRHGIFRDWTVIKIFKIPNTTTTAEVCGKLWAGLKGHWQCAVTSPHGCDKSRNKGEADVEWWFHTPIVCQDPAIEAAFDWATESRFGGNIDCERFRRDDDP